MAVGRKTNAIQSLGSSRMYYREVNADGSELTPTPDTWREFPIVSSSKFADRTNRDTVYDEEGTKYMIDGNRDVDLSGEILQTDDDSMAFFTDTVRGKYYRVIKELNRVMNASQYQYLVFAAGSFDPAIDISYPGRRISWMYVPNKMTASTTVSLTGITGMKATLPASTTVDADNYYKRLVIS